MPRGKILSDSEKKKILSYQKRNYSIRKIATNIKRSHGLVANFLKNPDAYGTARRSGRPSKVTPRIRRIIINESSNSTKSANQIIRENNLDLSKPTFQSCTCKLSALESSTQNQNYSAYRPSQRKTASIR